MRMELGLSQHQALKQIQTLSPQMFMSMEILQLNTLDLEERIDTELENNETLDLVEAAPRKETALSAAATAEAAAPLAERREGFEDRLERWDDYSREEYGSGHRSTSSYSGEKDEKLEALSNTEGRPESLQEHLENQLHLLDRTELEELVGPLAEGEEEAVRDCAVTVIYNIDHRGYLMYSIDEIVASLESRPPRALVEKAVKVVQGLEPPGIGGHDLKECLLLQLRRDRQTYPIEEKIIEHHLDDLAANRLPKIAKALGIGLEDVKTATENIVSLDPLPGRLFGAEAPRILRPDVVVEEVEGRFEVRVDQDFLPRLQVSTHYRDLYKASRGNAELKKYLKKKLDSAEWLLAAIRQRHATLQRIAQEIVAVQQGFLEHGVSHLKPLKMEEIAERVGVHVSTISRAIREKYMQTPRGILSLKSFFTGGTTKSDGTVESRDSVMQRISELVGEEDKSNPLSDIDIAKRLKEKSIHISRRTVTKYREAMGIPSSRQRRAY